MRPNEKTPGVDRLPMQVASLERSFKSSKLARNASIWALRVVWFKRQTRLVQFLLGGRAMLTLLEGCYDIALEDYIQETDQWQ